MKNANFSAALPYYINIPIVKTWGKEYYVNFTSGPANFAGKHDNFKDKCIDGANFKGSTNCYINPQTVKSMEGLKLDDVIFYRTENMWDGYSDEEISYFSQAQSQIDGNMYELTSFMKKLQTMK